MASGYGLHGGIHSPLHSGLRDLAQYPPTRLRAQCLLTDISPLLGPSRCFPFWQEVLGCYVLNSGDGESGKKKCLPILEDYYECLHHKKEVRNHLRPSERWIQDCPTELPLQAARTRAMQHAYRKAEASHPRENTPRAEQISSLGLLGKEEDTKTVLGSQ